MSNARYLSAVLTLTLLLTAVAGPGATPSPPAGQSRSPETALPETLEGVRGATTDWWSAVQEDIRQSEYHITWQERTNLADVEAAHQAPNRAHNLRTTFTPQGIRVVPRLFEGETPPWEWGLTLSGYGYASAAPLELFGGHLSTGEADVRPVAAATLHADGNRIEYDRGPLTEWYVNGENGLEQGFTLQAPPESAHSAPGAGIVLDLELGGNLTPHLSADGSGVEFTTRGGVRVLRYSQLHAYDANGRTLPAKMRLVTDRVSLNTQCTIRIVVDDTDAVHPITVDPLATGPNWAAESDQAGALYGISVGTAGDVNDDGHADVIVGAHQYDSGETNEGMAFVYHGSATGLSTSPDWTAESDQADAQFGRSVGTAGDVNNDGCADVIIGAYLYDNNQTNEGMAFVYHGSATGLSTTPWTAESDQANAYFGYSVGTAGDVNNDGYSDVVIGAYLYDNGQTNEGMATVYHGSATGLSTTAAWTAESDQANAYFGWSVGTAGDVDGDGYADVIVGAYQYDDSQTDEGSAFVYYGSATGLSTSPDWTVESDQDGAWFGYSVATAGDVNGDGYADVIIGACFYDNGEMNEGRATVYHGSAAGLSTTADWTAESDQAGAYFGASVAPAGDLDGDGYGDVIVGAHGYDDAKTDEGRAAVYHGSVTGLSTTADWAVAGSQDDAQLGQSVAAAGDVNGDGYADVIVGAHGYDNGEADEGRALVYHGSAAGLSTPADWTAESGQAGAEFGCSVGTAGDVNGDGYADVIVGAQRYDNGQADEGRAFVYHGSVTGLSATADWSAESNQANAYFGCSVGTAGDVNGDGYADVIVGVHGYDISDTDEGCAFVYHGSATGLSTTAGWTAYGDQDEANFGYSVGTAGDVDGDGYSDVIVGVPYYDHGETDEGQAAVFHGSATGLSPTADWTAENNQAGAEFGCSVGTAGDVDGDGYADVIVGAHGYENGEANEGRATVYHGSATGLSLTADWTMESNQIGAEFGYSVGTAGDVNGDGYADVIVGIPLYDDGETTKGQATVYHGSAAGLSATADWTAPGDQTDAEFGNSVGTAGDVDGDGYADVIVGAHGYGNGQVNEGRATVYRGSATGLATTPAWSAEGNQTDAEFGISVGTAGDVNGDGYSDVIVGAPVFDNGETDEGRASVYHGSAAGPSTREAWAAESNQAGAEFGNSVGTAGDVNGDGYADVIVGAPAFDNGEVQEGRVFVYHGSATGLPTTADWIAESDHANAYFGISVGTAGDVNGDGYADVIVGAPQYDNGETDEGRAFVYHGSATGLSNTADWSAESNQASAWFGISVATAGDVNGDGYADVVVGARYYDNGETDEGQAFVYHGSTEGLSTTPNWTAESDQVGAYFGISVGTAGDVNGDGYSDVIVGAFWYDNRETNEGRAFVYHGSGTGLSTSADWTAEGGRDSAFFGQSVGTAGDINDDGYADVIVGAPYYENDQVNEGWASVYHGSPTGLSNTANWMAEGNRAGACFGWSVGTAGDVNGDGYADVIVGAPYDDGRQTEEGRTYLYRGSALGLGLAWAAESDQDYAEFGNSVGTAGDINGDGYADVIVGAPQFDNGETAEGRVFLYYGNAGDGLQLLPRQMRNDASAPIAPLGMSDSGAAFQLSLIGRMPLGREDVRLQWQVAPLGTSFTSPGVISGTSGWIDLATTSVEITQTVSGLAPETPYHWRVRLLYRPGNALGLPASRWIHMPWNGWNETDLRTGSPTAVDLVAFTATPTPSGVRLDWETASEIDLMGFHLYRADGENPNLVRINPNLIPPQVPGGLTGAVYSYLDGTVQSGRSYTYWLENVDTLGRTGLHGPQSAFCPYFVLLPLVVNGQP